MEHVAAGPSRVSKGRGLSSATPSVSRSRSPDKGKHRVGPEAVKGLVCESKLGRRPTLDGFGYPVQYRQEASETPGLRYNLLQSPAKRHDTLVNRVLIRGAYVTPPKKRLDFT